jgi:actin related protein 2/3 complex, subunit 5
VSWLADRGVRTKEQHTNSVIDVLNAIKSTDIGSHLMTLDVDAQDALMKHLYKGMEQPKVYNTAVLLNWHEKVLSIMPLLANL